MRTRIIGLSGHDFVVATGRSATVREMCRIAFSRLGLNWEDHVVVDPSLLRPAEVEALLGDPTKARQKLGWSGTTALEDLVAMMVDADMERVGRE